ncbi:MAG TPA: NAD(P)-dependent oxidoreductase [Gemmataceae bacterium]|jgi:nucleoside-diphosphate-sugar epimerase|nr:NAD(P)-dependent oxidoreductase [Gemmataceae bacterium]
MTTKRVLVTGASGFIGRHSLPALVEREYEIHAVYAKGLPEGPGTWHRADLLDPVQRDRLLDEVRPTHLLHFAWYAVHGSYWTSVENLRWVEASLALLRRFADHGGRRAVLAGTCAEYDWDFEFCSEEATPANPKTLYGVSKNALRLVAEAFARQTGLSLAWGRIFFPYGPGEQAGRLIPSVIRSLQHKEPVRCSDGRQYRDFIFVGDCAGAFAALLDSEVEGVVNIGSGKPLTIREVVAAIVAEIPGASEVPVEFGAVAARPGDPPMLLADIRRLVNEVKWKPETELNEGIRRTVLAGQASATDLRTGRHEVAAS